MGTSLGGYVLITIIINFFMYRRQSHDRLRIDNDCTVWYILMLIDPTVTMNTRKSMSAGNAGIIAGAVVGSFVIIMVVAAFVGCK